MSALRWVRPLQGIVAMLGEAIVPVAIEGSPPLPPALPRATMASPTCRLDELPSDVNTPAGIKLTGEEIAAALREMPVVMEGGATRSAAATTFAEISAISASVKLLSPGWSVTSTARLRPASPA